MNPTKIEWCDMTWNPVTGCLHNCEYCYARKIAKRFGGSEWEIASESNCGREVEDCGETEATGKIHELKEPLEKGNGRASFPYYFDPTFHKYRLDDPQSYKKPQNVFVCSMADLFGNWVPDGWIKAVFEACEKAPQHRYLFLTKNSYRYKELQNKKLLPSNFYKFGKDVWFGVTLTNSNSLEVLPHIPAEYNLFVSYEPILNSLELRDCPANTKWVILGAESGNRKNKVIPPRHIIENLVKQCQYKNVPVFMKNSLAGIWGKELIQQYPWEV